MSWVLIAVTGAVAWLIVAAFFLALCRQAALADGALLQQPRQPPVLEQLALGLASRAVAHHVVLVEHRFELVAAARARFAVTAVDGERHRQAGGNRQGRGLLLPREPSA